MTITPIDEIKASARPRTMGNIRLGIKVTNAQGKEHAKAIDKFRFTSSDEPSIRKLAEDYGGEPSWSEKDHWWDVRTEAREIDVVLPNDMGFHPLGETPIYELWSKAGLQRRCTGVTCTLAERIKTPDGFDVSYSETDCLCVAERKAQCKPTTRLNVFLPQARLGGVWLLTSGSWGAAHEMEPMVNLIRAAQARGLTAAKLRTETRHQQGTNKPFIVPVLVLDSTIMDLAEGRVAIGPPQGSPQAVGPAPMAELEPGEPVEAEMLASPQHQDRVKRLWAGLTPTQREGVYVWMATEGIDDTHNLTVDQADKIVALMQPMVEKNEEPF